MALTINDLANNAHEQRVFVRNLTKAPDRALILVSVANGNRTDSVRVPPTWIPIEVTQFTTKDALLKCTDFRRALANNLLGLVDIEDAEAILQSEDGRDEARRVSAAMGASAQVVSLARSAEASGVMDPAITHAEDEAAGERARSVIQVEMLLQRLIDREFTESDALVELRNLGIDNDLDALRCARDLAKTDKRWPLIFKWARNGVRRLSDD